MSDEERTMHLKALLASVTRAVALRDTIVGAEERWNRPSDKPKLVVRRRAQPQ